jgi:hypothetical protein
MATPSVPQREPQDSKDGKNAVMRESLVSTLKKGYEAAKNPTQTPKKRASLIQLRDGITDPNNSFQVWKYPS